MTDTPPFLGDLISRHSAKLTEADTRLLDVMVRDPIRAAMENGKEVSFRAGVHPASAVRLARRLGFKGYPEFRAFLQSNLVEGQGEFEAAGARIAARLARAEEGQLLSSVLDSEVAALEALRASCADADIRAFSQVLLPARRIFVFSSSHGEALSHLIAMRLRRSGYDAMDLAAEQTRIWEYLAGMGKGDVLWLIALRKTGDLLHELRALAAERGAAVLSLRDPRSAPFEPAAEAEICASRGGAGEHQSLVVPMTIANTVILDLASIDEGRTMRALDRFRALREAAERR